jgi:hypothetical protein|eukprot:CAMPEP_0119176412 /NCGR_PEP_ID=MMETSP1315-20130426/45419_1 /TAXON_ID=676789 /ORGANISM="Prasinoderma singularis, Strain RCC927" /LENGTH=80 /DNA_ID=CAMNT_0007170525 /DNA_START=65 /DNA_END=307 /DNA_ORIENTATION=+
MPPGGGGGVIDAIVIEDRLKEEGASVIAALTQKYVGKNSKGETVCKACDMILRGGSKADIRSHYAYQHTNEVKRILEQQA